MAQILSLTTPIPPVVPPSTQSYSLVRLVMQRVPYAMVMVMVTDNNNKTTEVVYRDDNGGTVAAQLISSLNTANCSVKSFQQRVLERLMSDGKLPAGAVTGVPD